MFQIFHARKHICVNYQEPDAWYLKFGGNDLQADYIARTLLEKGPIFVELFCKRKIIFSTRISQKYAVSQCDIFVSLLFIASHM